MSDFSNSKKIATGGAILLLMAVVFLAGRGSRSADTQNGNLLPGEAGSSGGRPSDLAPPPEADPLGQLPPSPLNALLVEGLTPEKQTDIVGHFLHDYWLTHRSLPTGTFEEIRTTLSGGNRKGIEHLPPEHPSLSERGFRAKNDSGEIVIHVRSSRDGVFDLIYTGEDGLVFTDDDLVRSFPQ